MMAMQPDIQYISFYMDGSAAKKMEQQLLHPAAAPKPKQRKVKRRVVTIDPVAVLGLVVAVVMLITMGSGIARYRQSLQTQQEMRQYILALQQENIQLQQTYEAGYDLEEIRQIAEAVGMVPAQEVEHISIPVTLPRQDQAEPSFWEKVSAFVAGLFA